MSFKAFAKEKHKRASVRNEMKEAMYEDAKVRWNLPGSGTPISVHKNLIFEWIIVCVFVPRTRIKKVGGK